MTSLASSDNRDAEIAENNRIKERAALFSVAVKIALAAGKLVAGLLSGSLALLSEAANNIGDIAITVFSFVAIKLANKPADDNHQYGHAKIEALAALIETGFLFGLAVYIIATSIRRLGGAEEAEVIPSALSYGVLIVSIVVDSFRWYRLDKVAKATKSEALAADALNFASDIVASTLALVGLIGVQMGFEQGDALAALGVGLFIGVAGFGLGRRTINTLTDAAPPGLTEQIKSVVSSVPGVIALDSLRLRPSGADVFGDIAIAVPRTLPLERLTTIKEAINKAILAKYPEVSLTITARPMALDNESIIDRALLIAAKRHVPIHHIIVQEIDGRTSLSFDVELDGRMTHGQAHEIVSGLEIDMRKELGFDIEVDTHLEPLEPQELPGQNASAETRARIAQALADRAAQRDVVTDVHNIRVRETPSGLVVNYHCRVNPDLSVADVHEAVDDLDHMAQEDFPEVVRIVGHAEPTETDVESGAYHGCTVVRQ